MWWPIGYRNCTDVFGLAKAQITRDAPHLKPDSEELRERALLMTIEILEKSNTLSVAFLDGRIVRVSPDIFLSAMAAVPGRMPLTLLYWNDRFTFDPYAARLLAAGYSLVYEDEQKPKTILGKLAKLAARAFKLQTALRPSIAALEAATRCTELTLQNMEAERFRSGQLVIESDDFLRIESDMGNTIGQTHKSDRGQPGRPDKVSKLAAHLIALFPDGPPQISRKLLWAKVHEQSKMTFAEATLDRARAIAWSDTEPN